MKESSKETNRMALVEYHTKMGSLLLMDISRKD